MKIRLALSGSGSLACIHAGAICAFVDEGIELVEIASTSGGSIVGLAYAAGLRSDELFHLAVIEPMSQLLHRSYLRVVLKGQEDSGETLYRWLDAVFRGKKMRDSIVPIQVFATDLKKGLFSFTPADTPDVPMALAARASAAVPKIWDPVQWGGTYFVDGGVRANIPIDYLVRDGTSLVGIKVMEQETYDVSTRLARDEAVLGHMLSSNEEHEILLGQALGATIIKVDAGTAGFLDFSLPMDVRKKLFDAGFAAVKDAGLRRTA